jgi:hypothetical protein
MQQYGGWDIFWWVMVPLFHSTLLILFKQKFDLNMKCQKLKLLVSGCHQLE